MGCGLVMLPLNVFGLHMGGVVRGAGFELSGTV